jgi:hypothetical protein
MMRILGTWTKQHALPPTPTSKVDSHTSELIGAEMPHVRFGSKADMCGAKSRVCFTLIATVKADIAFQDPPAFGRAPE